MIFPRKQLSLWWFPLLFSNFWFHWFMGYNSISFLIVALNLNCFFYNFKFQFQRNDMWNSWSWLDCKSMLSIQLKYSALPSVKTTNQVSKPLLNFYRICYLFFWDGLHIKCDGSFLKVCSLFYGLFYETDRFSTVRLCKIICCFNHTQHCV